jgi:hypothetical protein
MNTKLLQKRELRPSEEQDDRAQHEQPEKQDIRPDVAERERTNPPIEEHQRVGPNRQAQVTVTTTAWFIR